MSNGKFGHEDASAFQFGLNTFGDVPTENGVALSDAQGVRALVHEAQLAEASGLDVFGVGEHYREGAVDSATPVLLAAIAQATEKIKLSTAVTVLSTQDPVRLYQQFATVDAISEGRTEMVLGRASAIESFPLFGYDIAEYDQIFEEKLELFSRLLKEDRVTWAGKYRSALNNVRLHPRMPDGGIPTWMGIGGSPESVIRAAKYGMPLMMAVIGGRPERFAGHAELYLKALAQFGTEPMPIGQHSIGLIAQTDEQARDEFWKYWEPMVAQMSKERGFYAPTAARYAEEVDTGALFVGSVETVAQKIAYVAQANHLSRFDLKYDLAGMPRAAREQTITLLGEQVAPRVRELLDERREEWKSTGRPVARITKSGTAVHA